MKVSIKNFIACNAAEIECDAITFVTGRNEAGKSSICLAASAALTGKAVPIEDLTKSNFPGLIGRKGEKSIIEMESPEGSTVIDYPECTVFSTGSPIQISEHSAGAVSLASIPKKERARFIGELLKTDPTEAELLEVVKKSIPGTEELFPALWKNIQATGWDGALAHCKEVGTRLKGRWESVTGDKFGTKKYLDWKPARFDQDFTVATEAELVTTVKQDTEWLEAAISEIAVDTAQMSELKKQAAGVPRFVALLKSADDQLAPLEADAVTIRHGLDKLPPAAQPVAQSCPHCNKPVSVEFGKVKPVLLLTPEEVANRKTAIDDAAAALEKVYKKIADLRNDRAKIASEITAAQSAEKRVADIESRPAASGNHVSVDAMKKQLEDSKLRLAAFKQWTEANDVSESITMNLKLQEILDPSGIRLSKLLTVLSKFNQICTDICAAAEWPFVNIKEDMSIWQEKYPYMLISDGAKFRARVVLQLAVAQIIGDGVVIIDKADILDSAGRNGLISVLQDFAPTTKSIVGMTYASREAVPALGSLIPGVNMYWLENGEASKI